MRARRHDNIIGIGFRKAEGAQIAGFRIDQFVAGQIGQIVERLDPLFPQRNHHVGAQGGQLHQILGNAERGTAFAEFRLCLLQIGLGAGRKLFGHLLVETFDRRQFLDRHIGQILRRMKPFGHQKLGDHLIDIENVHEGFRTQLEFGLPAFGFLVFGQDIDIPAGQLRGQAHILAAAADGQAELIVGNDDFDALRLFIQHHLDHLGRGQGVDDEGCRIGRPFDDVDLLALQLVDHRLHAAAAHADTGTDRIDGRIVRSNGNLGAAAGIAGHGLQLDDAIVDFRHLLSEQLGHELRMGARKENLRPALFAAHIVDIGANTVVLLKAFARQQLVAAHDRLGMAQIDGDIAVFDALDLAVDDIADPVLELLVLALAFGIAHLLHDHLLGRLRRHAAEIDRGQRIVDIAAHFDFGILVAGILKQNFGGLVFDFLDHLAAAGNADFTGLAVDLGDDIVLQPIAGPRRLLDGFFHRLQNDVGIDMLFARYRIGNLQQFQTIGGRSHASNCSRNSDLTNTVAAARSREATAFSALSSGWRRSARPSAPVSLHTHPPSRGRPPRHPSDAGGIRPRRRTAADRGNGGGHRQGGAVPP